MKKTYRGVNVGNTIVFTSLTNLLHSKHTPVTAASIINSLYANERYRKGKTKVVPSDDSNPYTKLFIDGECKALVNAETFELRVKPTVKSRVRRNTDIEILKELVS